MAFFSGNKQADDEDKSAKNIFVFQLVPKNVLVTGSNGQLGSELKRATADHEANLNFIFTDIAELDITNLQAVEQFVKENNIQIHCQLCRLHCSRQGRR